MAVVVERSLHDYLEQLPPTTSSRLYSAPATCLAIFRLLSRLARHYVTSLLFRNTAISIVEFEKWSTLESKGKQAAAFEKLQRMNVLTERHGKLILNSGFRTNMKLALTGGGNHNSFGSPDPDGERVDLSFLENYCTQTWEDILHFMVGTTFDRQPGPSIVRLLLSSGLIDKSHRITSSGFQFLLQGANAQIWALLLQYLEASDLAGADPVELIHFLFMLGHLELGTAYMTSNLSEFQLSLLQDLVEFGMIWQEAPGDAKFWPTHMATTLTKGSSLRNSASKGTSSNDVNDSDMTGFVILETNYKLYAYTSSPLQIAVLELFTDLTSRFPNFCTGQLSRNSIRRALVNGITADQVILYLTSHAHSQMRKSTPLLPPTVVDQIRLWELEKNRLKATTGYLFRDFYKVEEYQEAVKYARDTGVLVYENTAKLFFFVSIEGVSSLTAFIKRKAEERKCTNS